MPACRTCFNLSVKLDETLSAFNVTLEKIKQALKGGNLKRIAALDRELETAVVNRDAAYKAWIDHRQTHRV
jgi:hypothetical protein